MDLQEEEDLRKALAESIRSCAENAGYPGSAEKALALKDGSKITKAAAAAAEARLRQLEKRGRPSQSPRMRNKTASADKKVPTAQPLSASGADVISISSDESEQEEAGSWQSKKESSDDRSLSTPIKHISQEKRDLRTALAASRAIAPDPQEMHQQLVASVRMENGMRRAMQESHHADEVDEFQMALLESAFLIGKGEASSQNAKGASDRLKRPLSFPEDECENVQGTQDAGSAGSRDGCICERPNDLALQRDCKSHSCCGKAPAAEQTDMAVMQSASPRQDRQPCPCKRDDTQCCSNSSELRPDEPMGIFLTGKDGLKALRDGLAKREQSNKPQPRLLALSSSKSEACGQQ